MRLLFLGAAYSLVAEWALSNVGCSEASEHCQEQQSVRESQSKECCLQERVAHVGHCCILPESLYATVNVYYQACSHCYSNCFYIFYSNKITPLMDLLLHQLTLYVPEEDKSIFGRTVNKQIFEGLTTGLLQTIATVVNHLEPAELEAGKSSSWIWSPDMKTKSVESFTSRAQDLISYVVNMGVIDQLYGCFLSVQGPVDESPKMSAFLEQATAFLHALCKLCFVVNGRSSCIFDNKRQDPTGLTALLQNTDLVGVLHMLYCILLHSTESGSMASLQEPYNPAVIQVALQGLRFLNSFALLDLTAFQSVLGAEGLSLAFRHIVSSLLWYCSQNSSEELLHEVIICVGYFTVNHPDNQVSIVWTESNQYIGFSEPDFIPHSYQHSIKEQTRPAQVSFLFTLGYSEPVFAFRRINFTLPLFSVDRPGIM
ncbi:S phase cyclin A-associated protein in the endoplasmic reticulum isoform X1 [Tachysurus ichikawai]